MCLAVVIHQQTNQVALLLADGTGHTVAWQDARTAWSAATAMGTLFSTNEQLHVLLWHACHEPVQQPTSSSWRCAHARRPAHAINLSKLHVNMLLHVVRTHTYSLGPLLTYTM